MFKFEQDSVDKHIDNLLDQAYSSIQQIEKLSTLLGSYPTIQEVSLQEVNTLLQNKIRVEDTKLQIAFNELKDVLVWIETKDI
jgi:hypothetical protein